MSDMTPMVEMVLEHHAPADPDDLETLGPRVALHQPERWVDFEIRFRGEVVLRLEHAKAVIELLDRVNAEPREV